MPNADKGEGIKTPHDHDVLSGRGNFVNYHPGNEHFRSLVRKHKVEYVKCPKPQKGKFSKMIYDEIKARDPPGRFLKQEGPSKMWYDIGEKKALDKTRQALREGAPELMKEMSGESSDEDTDDEQVIARKKKTGKNSSLSSGGPSTLGSMFPGDNLQNPFLGGFPSPGALSRNGMMSIGSIGMSPITSPGLLSPGMMMTPDMQFSTQGMQSETGMAGRLQSPLSDVIPPPQVHVANSNNPENMSNMMSPQQQHQILQQQQQQLEQMQQQLTQQQQQFMMNAAAMNNMGSNFDMMNSQQQQQHQLQQMRINQMRQQIMNNQLQQQPQQMHMNQLRQQHHASSHQQQQNHHQQFQHPNAQPQTASELQMLQNKLAAIYSGEAFDPRPMGDQILSSNGKSSGSRTGDSVTAQSMGSKFATHNADANNMDNTLHVDNTGRGSSSRVEMPPGNNPRRMPPPSLLKRDDSLKMDKIFEPASPGGAETKKKYSDGHNSSAHLSAMSLSMGDLNDEGNLSQVFDSSLKISGGSQKNNSGNIKTKIGSSLSSSLSTTKTQQNSKASSAGTWASGESKNGDKLGNNHSWENANFDMSVATIGASEIGASEIGNMSYATLNMPDHEGQLSFSRLFEESEK